MDCPFLHDKNKILYSISDDFEVRDGITIDKQQIRERAFLDDAKLAGKRIARAAEGEQLGVV